MLCVTMDEGTWAGGPLGPSGVGLLERADGDRGGGVGVRLRSPGGSNSPASRIMEPRVGSIAIGQEGFSTNMGGGGNEN